MVDNKRDKRYNFEDYFNYDEISSEQIFFARHYIENLMGIELDNDSTIEFASIRSSVFGFLVAHIASEYEEYNKLKCKDGFKTSPPDEM